MMTEIAQDALEPTAAELGGLDSKLQSAAIVVPPAVIPLEANNASKRPLRVAVIDEHSLTRECIASSFRELADDLEISSPAGPPAALHDGFYDLLLYHWHGQATDRDTADSAFAYLRKLSAVAPVVVLSAIDDPASILDAFDNGARGYIPTKSTTMDLALEILRVVRAGGTFVPLNSLSLGGGNGGEPVHAAPLQRFTPREKAVLALLKRGKANKIIAHELHMSESTVKLHIHNIMRKMKVSNRTEIVCRAFASKLI